jgi:hypothetical protein
MRQLSVEDEAEKRGREYLLDVLEHLALPEDG